MGLRNNWYQSYNSTIIEIGAQRPQIGSIAWPNVVTVKSMVEISQNFVAFSEFMNFNKKAMVELYENIDF